MKCSQAMMRYVSETHSIPLLAPEEEIMLSGAKNHPEATEEEKDMAISMLVEHNLRLVVSVANRFGLDEDFEDIVFDGNHGLIEAAKRFDHRKGHRGKGRFTTYAMHWILKYMRDGFKRRNYKVVSIPKTAESNSRRMDNNLILDGDSDISEIMEELGISESKAVAAKKANDITVCLIGDPEDGGRDVVDTSTKDSYEAAVQSDLVALLHRVFKELKLSKDEIHLVSLEKGQSDGFSAKLAEKMGVTRSNVRMIRKKLLWRVRRRLQTILGKKEFESLSTKIVPGDWRKPTLDREARLVRRKASQKLVRQKA